jgi:hypothetical protein
VRSENQALKDEMAPMQKEITSIKDEKATLEDESSTVAKHVSSSQPDGPKKTLAVEAMAS